MTRPAPLHIGDVVHGYAYGAFGRDHYRCVRVEAVGRDWIVTRDGEYDTVDVVSGRESLELCIRARDEACPNDDPCGLEAPAHQPLTTWSPS